MLSVDDLVAPFDLEIRPSPVSKLWNRLDLTFHRFSFFFFLELSNPS